MFYSSFALFEDSGERVYIGVLTVSRVISFEPKDPGTQQEDTDIDSKPIGNGGSLQDSIATPKKETGTLPEAEASVRYSHDLRFLCRAPKGRWESTGPVVPWSTGQPHARPRS